MFDNTSLKLYRDTVLTRDMRAEILARHDSRHAWMRGTLRTATALASLVLVVAVVFAIATNTQTHVSMGGVSLTQTARALSTEEVAFHSGYIRTMALEPTSDVPLTTARQCVPIQTNFEKDVFLTVSGGILIVPDADGHPTYAGTSAVVAAGMTVYWALDQCETLSPLVAEIRDMDETLLSTVTLTYHEGRGTWLGSSKSVEK